MDCPFEAVIFDMDGVIADTVGLHYEANQHIAKKLSVTFSEEMNQSLQGLSREKTVRAICDLTGEEVSDEQVKQLSELRNEQYQRLIAELTPADALPGIYSFIRELKEKKISIALASASTNAPRVLSRLQLIDAFDVIVDVQKVRRGKPDPEIFLTAAQLLGVSSNRCVAIEDGEAGLTGILQTEMFAVGVGTHLAMKKAHWQVASTEELSLKSLINAVRMKRKKDF